MTDWQDQYLPRRPNPITQSWPSNEVRRQRRVHPTRGTANGFVVTVFFIALVVIGILFWGLLFTWGAEALGDWLAAMATHPDCPTPEC